MANISKLGEEIGVSPTKEVTLMLITKGKEKLNGKEEDDVLGKENIRDWKFQGSEQNPEMAET